jgi:hypothetical protein
MAIAREDFLSWRVLSKCGLSALVTLLVAMSGCAGALGVYVPGSGNKAGAYQTATDLGNGLARVEEHWYEVGDDGPGVALGAKAGQSWVTLGGTSLEPGFAAEAHADLSYCRGPFGVIWQTGFGVDRGYMADETEVRYGGLSTGLVGQFMVIPRIVVHAGLHKMLTGSVQVGDAEGVGAKGFRVNPGVDLSFYRGTKNEFILRLDLRHTRSGEAMMGTTDVSFVGNALLAQLVWVSTP